MMKKANTAADQLHSDVGDTQRYAQIHRMANVSGRSKVVFVVKCFSVSWQVITDDSFHFNFPNGFEEK